MLSAWGLGEMRRKTWRCMNAAWKHQRVHSLRNMHNVQTIMLFYETYPLKCLDSLKKNQQTISLFMKQIQHIIKNLRQLTKEIIECIFCIRSKLRSMNCWFPFVAKRKAENLPKYKNSTSIVVFVIAIIVVSKDSVSFFFFFKSAASVNINPMQPESIL